jgi:single-stranded-DNA-specific exonuclease
LKVSSQRWIEPAPVRIPPDLEKAFGEFPLVAEALARRGITRLEQAGAFFDPARYLPAPPADLPDLSKAADRLEKALSSGEKIGVWGDFDVDGQTATTLLVNGLRKLGGNVTYHIPVRERESHGVNLEFLQPFLQSGVQLLLTCDTGITAHAAVEYTRQQGVNTIITDHHSLPPELPEALAVVNPQRLAADHPLRPLCGAGCAYMLVEELFRRGGRLEEASQFHDLVALGTVADMAGLTGDCRYLVQSGLALLREHTRPAIKAILEQAEVKETFLTEEHISFVLAPRLNAIGRLGDANPMVDFLTSTDPQLLKRIAISLEALNGKRKLLCEQVFEGAQAQIKRDPSLLDDPALVLSHPQWPAGVIGIVASRLVELYHRPALLISAPPGQNGRGSARSIEGINITSAIAANQQLLLGFGGHPMAAGFGIDPLRISEFRRALGRTIATVTQGEMPVFELPVEAYLNLGDISLELVEALERLAPFGPGNPSLILAARNLTLQSSAFIGKTREHLQLIVEDSRGASKRVLWWQGDKAGLPEGPFDMAYSLRSSNYRGLPEVQIEWIDARPIEGSLAEQVTQAIEVLDYRNIEDPKSALEKLQKEKDLVVWSEGSPAQDTANFTGVDRYHLHIAGTLVVWSIPPGRRELQQAIDVVIPRRVALFNTNSASDQPGEFLKRLAGLVRFAIKNRQGAVTISELAAAMGQREATVQSGLDWLAARGFVHTVSAGDQPFQLAEGGQADQDRSAALDEKVRYLLQETAAFRGYYLRANPVAIVKSG